VAERFITRDCTGYHGIPIENGLRPRPIASLGEERAILGLMADERLPHFARAWLEQWRGAALELAEQKRLELRSLTDEQARAATDALLEIGASLPLPASRERTSGLVTQQAILHATRPGG
jgi:hypothetical protein